MDHFGQSSTLSNVLKHDSPEIRDYGDEDFLDEVDVLWEHRSSRKNYVDTADGDENNNTESNSEGDDEGDFY